VWVKNISKMELFENDDVTMLSIDFEASCILQCGQKTFDAILE